MRSSLKFLLPSDTAASHFYGFRTSFWVQCVIPESRCEVFAVWPPLTRARGWPRKMAKDEAREHESRHSEGEHIDSTGWSVLIRRTWTSTVMPLMPLHPLLIEMYVQTGSQPLLLNSFNHFYCKFDVINTSAPYFTPSNPSEQRCFAASPTKVSRSGPGPGQGNLLVQIPFLPRLLDFIQNSFVCAYRPVPPCSLTLLRNQFVLLDF